MLALWTDFIWLWTVVSLSFGTGEGFILVSFKSNLNPATAFAIKPCRSFCWTWAKYLRLCLRFSWFLSKSQHFLKKSNWKSMNRFPLKIGLDPSESDRPPFQLLHKGQFLLLLLISYDSISPSLVFPIFFRSWFWLDHKFRCGGFRRRRQRRRRGWWHSWFCSFPIK